MNSKLIFLVTIGIAIIGAFLLFPKPGPQPELKARNINQAEPQTGILENKETVQEAELSAEEAAKALAEQMSILPESLKDVPRPLPLDTDEGGYLIINSKIKILFDYYLSALGEEDQTVIRTRVEHSLSELPSPAGAQALQIFDNYVAYLQAIDQLNQSYSGAPVSPAETAEIIRIKEQVLSLRRQFFSPEVASAFFAKDDAWDNYAIQRLKIGADDLLNDTEKTAAIEALDVLLPPEILQQKQQSDLINDYRSASENARENSGNDSDIQAKRTDIFGAEAAGRLQALDQRRAKWDGRVSAYREERNQALEFLDPGSVAYQETLAAVRGRHFEAAELQRIAALDEIKKLESVSED